MPVLPDPRREAFCRFVAEGRSKREAALSVGYGSKSVSAMGSRLFKLAPVQARIAELQQQAAELSLAHMQVTRERVLAEYARLAFLDIRKAFTPDGELLSIVDMDEDTARAIAGLEFEEIFEQNADGQRTHSGRIHKLKLIDKKGALDSLAKHLGLFREQLEITGKDGGPIEIDDARQHLAARIAGIAARIRADEDSRKPDSAAS